MGYICRRVAPFRTTKFSFLNRNFRAKIEQENSRFAAILRALRVPIVLAAL